MTDTRFRILVVDDEPVNIQLMENALSGEYEVLSALNGFDAIDIVKNQGPDLILLDVMMPNINGFDVSRIIRSNEMYAAIPIIFITAMDTFDAEAEGLKAGGIDFLTKPVNIELLKLRVHNHLELKRRNDVILEQRDLLVRKQEEIEASHTRIKHLEGIIPICMYCKSIRTDETSWQSIEQYITENSDALFSHGMCPECAEKQFEIVRAM